MHRVLAMAGGLTEKAERGLLQILRRVEGREDTVAVQLIRWSCRTTSWW
ncbi:MAG: hypothetical protein U0231_19240 [Nitrospiraceae bacterium]